MALIFMLSAPRYVLSILLLTEPLPSDSLNGWWVTFGVGLCVVLGYLTVSINLTASFFVAVIEGTSAMYCLAG